MTSKLWTEVTKTEHDHERAALHWIRERLPPREPFRAWANFLFLGDDGTRNEVDLLVVSPTGVYLVEIKSFPGGRIDGDAGTWTWTRPDGSRRTFDNPIRLAERKAKKLKSLLIHQPAFKTPRMRGESFYLKSIVFLSEPGLVIGLNEPGRVDVYGPDQPATEAPQENDLPGLIHLFGRIDPARGRQVDRPMSQAIAQAMDQAGIRESTTHRRVGEYVLEGLLTEGEGWQDFASKHPVTGSPRRIRVYLTAETLDDEEQAALRRAARREFKLLEGISVPGIDRPLELLENPMGPALVFERDPDAERLDHWLDDRRDELAQPERVKLLREVAEVVRSAHKHGLYHRGLSPLSIWVSGEGDELHLKVRDWHTATRSLAGTTSLSGTEHVADRISAESHVYLAPETFRVPNPAAIPADIWSLGAIGYRILTGEPPATGASALYETLREQGGLSLAAAIDAPDSWLDEVIRTATLGDATSRFVSVGEFLSFIDFALEQTSQSKDPLNAKRSDEFRRGDTTWKILERVGKGSTAVVLLAETAERQEILKIARDDENAVRIRTEFEVLEKLRDRTIIVPYGLEEIGGRTVLRLEAATGTLAEALRKDGSLSLDLLERFGGDLLDAIVYLDREGVAHRDIKPENLGIAERGKDRERRLVLLDFSLSKADRQSLRVGTSGYLDPFLEERSTPRWDEQAERYAAAVTLYEMATGTRPEWGGGSTVPVLTELQLPEIEADLFDPAVRSQLRDFFERALHRRPTSRFDTAGQMREAWRRVFQAAARERDTDHGVAIEELDLNTATETTTIAELGLPPKVRNALERIDVVTVEDLANYPAAELVRLSGIGAATRRRINELASRLRERSSGGALESGLGGASVDQIAAKLVPSVHVGESHQVAIAGLLGMVGVEGADWPGVNDAIAASDLDRAEIGSVLTSARGRWKRQPEITSVRQELFDALRTRGGILGGDEMAAILLSSRGSLASEPERSRRARAVVRASIEAETTLESPRFIARRLGSRFLVLLQGEHEVGGEIFARQPDQLLDFAAALAEVADEIATRTPLASAEEVERALRRVRRPQSLPPLDHARRVRLAASASQAAAVSARLELYPVRMDPARTVAECRATLLDRRGLTEEEVRSRIRARFPEAAELPGRPELDDLMESIGLEWSNFTRPDGSKSAGYVLPRRGGVLPTTFGTSLTSTSFASPDERRSAHLALDDRLAAFAKTGGFLALTVDRRYLPNSVQVVSDRLGASVRSLDGMLIDRMRAIATSRNAEWNRLLRADNEKGQRGWTILGQVVDQALQDVEEELVTNQGLLVLQDIGLLTRYERMDTLARLRDRLTQGPGGEPLVGLVVVVPGTDPNARPSVDGEAVPVITANQWAHIPSTWLKSLETTEAA